MSKSEEKAKQQEEKVETVDTEMPQQEAPQEEKELSVEEQLAVAKEQIEQEKKEYMFLLAEFDNFRKRTIKEKADIIKNASEKAMTDLLPVIDDMERAMQAIEASDNIDSAKEGINLIYNNNGADSKCQCLFYHKFCLRHYTLLRINKQKHTIYHFQDALNLSPKIRVSGSVNDINLCAFVINGCIFG